MVDKYEDEDTTTFRVGSRGKTWDLPFSESFDVLGCRFHRDGCVSEDRKDLVQKFGLVHPCAESWSCPQHCTELQHPLAVEWSKLDNMRAWEAKILRITFPHQLRLCVWQVQTALMRVSSFCWSNHEMRSCMLSRNALRNVVYFKFEDQQKSFQIGQ